jgi:hypothetical protein
MNTYYVHYNRYDEYVWQVHHDGKEYCSKEIKINVPSYGAKLKLDKLPPDKELYCICCHGQLYFDEETLTITINDK